MNRYTTYFLLGFALLVLPLTACSGDVPYPDIPKVPKAKGEQCVEPTEFMRRNHMDLILHQRDETVHKGIRTKKHSLAECINCHVNPGADGEYPRVSSKEHFCSNCHAYASVKIDCFECHNDRPSEVTAQTANKTTLLEIRSKPVNAAMDGQE